MLAEHPILPSLLFDYAERNSVAEGVDQHEVIRIQQLAEEAIQAQSLHEANHVRLASCDVILCASEHSLALSRSIASLLDQEAISVFIHLIDTGSISDQLDSLRSRCNLFVYRMAQGTTPLVAAHELLPTLQSEFIAVQLAECISHPKRLSRSISAIVDLGGEVAVSPVTDEDFAQTQKTRSLLCATEGLLGSLPGATIVVRRATFFDMHGATQRDSFVDHDAKSITGDSATTSQKNTFAALIEAQQFCMRARRQTRKIVQADSALVRWASDDQLPIAWCEKYQSRTSSSVLPANGRGFARVPVAADVVVPFHGHTDLLQETLDSLLDQTEASLTIHVVDDASPVNPDDALRRYTGRPEFRFYRNTENIGQFQSFNNVSPYFDTELALVQDADDLSLPERVYWTGQVMHYTQADFFAAAVETFMAPGSQLTNKASPSFSKETVWHSYYPEKDLDPYFAQNPTAAFRVSMFRTMGGFADFGDRLANRASVDTEFQLRCRHHGVRFALSRQVVLRYRRHASSATQNVLTGWGTSARKLASDEVERRCKLFRRGISDPRSFGSIGRRTGITQRIGIGA
jgi:glycosyltransferase involved in cell wall biosynthesis